MTSAAMALANPAARQDPKRGAVVPAAPRRETLARAAADAQTLLGLVNAERVRNQRAPLEIDPFLMAAAARMARERSEAHPLSNPDSKPVSARPTRAAAAYYKQTIASGQKPTFTVFGENVCHEAVGPVLGREKSALDAAEAWRRWQRYPDHANICLSPQWQAMGAAVYRAPNGSVCVAVIYGGVRQQSAANPNKATQKAPVAP
jgi:uncharacterized protein YkwD